MPTVFKLTWKDEQGGRWRKKYKGKQYSFQRKLGETKEASYRRSWAEWLKKKAEIDVAKTTEEPWRRAILNLMAETKVQLLETQLEDTPDNREKWVELFEQLKDFEYDLSHDQNPFLGTDEPGNLDDYYGGHPVDEYGFGPPPWVAGVNNGTPWNPEYYTLTEKPVDTLIANVKAFLKEKELNANAGELSMGRVEVLRVGLESFVKLAGSDLPIKQVGTDVLLKFRDELKTTVADKKLKPHSARDRLQSVKQFVRWCWVRELLSLPRILDRKEFSIALPDQRIETFTDDEVKRVLAEASESTKLYLLLCLNCGMTQGDISDLLQSEVDWTVGRINRKRSKTRKSGDNVPSVSYPLWTETFRLLTKCRSKHLDLALTNQNGGPLKVESILNGRAKKTDNIRSAYNRVAAKLKIMKPLKLLRKTAATKLGGHPIHSRFAQYFLGHAPTSVADKHYVAPSTQQFDEAVAWLGEQFCGPTPNTPPQRRTTTTQTPKRKHDVTTK